MKKPFLLLKGYKNICALAVCLILSVWAVCLLLAGEESIAVFAHGETEPQSLYGLVASLI